MIQKDSVSSQRDNILQENIYEKPRKFNVSGVFFLP